MGRQINVVVTIVVTIVVVTLVFGMGLPPRTLRSKTVFPLSLRCRSNRRRRLLKDKSSSLTHV